MPTTARATSPRPSTSNSFPIRSASRSISRFCSKVRGKFISDNALAAVGNSYEITLIFIAFAFGCNIACSVLAALFFGAKQYNDLKTTVYTALISSCVICAALMLVGTLCCDSLLRLIKTPRCYSCDEVSTNCQLKVRKYGKDFTCRIF